MDGANVGGDEILPEYCSVDGANVTGALATGDEVLPEYCCAALGCSVG